MLEEFIPEDTVNIIQEFLKKKPWEDCECDCEKNECECNCECSNPYSKDEILEYENNHRFFLIHL